MWSRTIEAAHLPTAKSIVAKPIGCEKNGSVAGLALEISTQTSVRSARATSSSKGLDSTQ